MAKNMTFEIDRSVVTEGDVVEIKWDCSGADRVELSIDNGYKTSVMPLDISGNKRFRLNRSKGRTTLTITAWVGEQHGSKTLKIRVKKMQTTHAETVDEKGHKLNSASEWWQQIRQRWQMLPPEKRMASRISMILAGILLIGMIIPRLFLIGLLGLMVYLLYTLWKK